MSSPQGLLIPPQQGPSLLPYQVPQQFSQQSEDFQQNLLNLCKGQT